VELIKFNTKKRQCVIAPIGDIQYSGKSGPTALDHVKRHIDRAMKLNAWFIGMGDMIDFLSPSNRQRLTAAALYDTADAVIDEKAHELVEEVYNAVLKPTRGRWIGLLEGHHYYEGQGSTSDMWLCEMLDAQFLGTSAYVRLEPSSITLYAHHGVGGGILPSAGINQLYHTSAGLIGADVYLMGHNTKLGAHRLSRPFPNWEGAEADLAHNDVLLVNTGGFSKSNIVRHSHGRIKRGDYAEQGMMTPSPLSAPLIYIENGRAECRL